MDKDFMDDLEKAVVSMVKSYMKTEMPDITDEQCRNLVGKVGTRITFGPEVFDKAFSTKPEKDKLGNK